MSRTSLILGGLTLATVLAGSTGCETFTATTKPEIDPEPYLLTTEAYEWKRRHPYNYYPEIDVYHNQFTGQWFWFEDDQWTSGSSLPHPFPALSSTPVVMDLDSQRPFADHSPTTTVSKRTYGTFRSAWTPMTDFGD